MTARVLMSWLADQYVFDETTSPIALRAVRDRPWNAHTRSIVVHRLLAYDGEMVSWLSPWLLLALQNSPHSRDEMLDMLLAESRWGDNIGLALTLLEDRTRPELKPTISFVENDVARFEIELPGDEYSSLTPGRKYFSRCSISTSS